MAAVPPAPGAAPAPPLPDSHVALHGNRGDALHGNCGPLCNRYVDFNGVDQDALWNRFAQATADSGVPKVFLYLVETANGQVVFSTHRPALCRGHPVEATQHDGRAYCFMGDKEAEGLHVNVLEFPAASFEVLANVLLYTVAETDVLVTAHGDQAAGLLVGPPAGAPNTEQVSVRRSVPVPFDLIQEVLDAVPFADPVLDAPHPAQSR